MAKIKKIHSRQMLSGTINGKERPQNGGGHLQKPSCNTILSVERLMLPPEIGKKARPPLSSPPFSITLQILVSGERHEKNFKNTGLK